MKAYLRAVGYHLPSAVLSNEDLAARNPAWTPATLFRKTGIRERRIAAPGETSADLAFHAANRLFEETGIARSDIDALLFCTQTPDHFLPASACLLQDRLQLPTRCAAFDFNLGCSGFTYGLWLAGSLIRSSAARNVLLLAADTLSRECDPADGVTVPIFGDGAGAAIIGSEPARAVGLIGHTVLGTDGRGGQHLIIAGGASRQRSPEADRCIRMNGAEVFNFTLTHVQDGIRQLLADLKLEDGTVDRYLLHQANGFILQTIRREMGLTEDQCPIDLEMTGNTSCASLPLLLRRCLDRGDVRPGHRCVLAGYGVGYSWAMTYLELLSAEGA